MLFRSVQDLTLPGEALVGAVVRRGQAKLATTNTRLEVGDILHITAAVAAIPKLEKLLAH